LVGQKNHHHLVAWSYQRYSCFKSIS
jgi:hypothetical protein